MSEQGGPWHRAEVSVRGLAARGPRLADRAGAGLDHGRDARVARRGRDADLARNRVEGLWRTP